MEITLEESIRIEREFRLRNSRSIMRNAIGWPSKRSV
jgi:hypothetical protein